MPINHSITRKIDLEQLDLEHRVVLELLVKHGSRVTNGDLVKYAALQHVYLTWDQVRSIRSDLFFMQGGR
jgi:hypothetical protein